jgi:hypothetical protein
LRLARASTQAGERSAVVMSGDETLQRSLAWLCDNDHEVAARELREAPFSMKSRVARAGHQLEQALIEYEPRLAKTTHQRAVELFRLASRARPSSGRSASARKRPLGYRSRSTPRKTTPGRSGEGHQGDIRTADIIQLESRHALFVEAR